MNLLIGYALVEQHDRLTTLGLFFVAMLVKFVITDRSLHRVHQQAYDELGRWLLAAAVVAGWGLGFLGSLGAVTPVMIQAFIAGGVLLNVFQEDLPAENQGRLGAFTAGALIFGALLVLI